MAKVKGHSLVAKALKNEGVEHLFWLLGGPMVGVSDDCHALGMKMLDVRHEQAAAPGDSCVSSPPPSNAPRPKSSPLNNLDKYWS